MFLQGSILGKYVTKAKRDAIHKISLETPSTKGFGAKRVDRSEKWQTQTRLLEYPKARVYILSRV